MNKISVLCFGDSNTFGHEPRTGARYAEEVRWPGKLKAMLGDNFTVFEEGQCGRTTVYDDPDIEDTNGLDAIERIIKIRDSFDVAIVMLGTNDLKVFANATPEDIAAGLDKIIKKLKPVTKMILVVSPPEIGSGIKKSSFYGYFREPAISKSRKLSPAFRKVAVENGCLFFDSSEWVKPSDYDSVHLIASDHAMLANKIFDIITSEKASRMIFQGDEN